MFVSTLMSDLEVVLFQPATLTAHTLHETSHVAVFQLQMPTAQLCKQCLPGFRAVMHVGGTRHVDKVIHVGGVAPGGWSRSNSG